MDSAHYFDADKRELARTFPAKRRRELFIAWFLVYGESERAALEAGYPPATAKQRGYELLRDPDIIFAIRQAQGERAKRINLTADRVLRELAHVALSNHDNYELNEHGRIVVKEDVSPAAMRAVKSIKYRREIHHDKGDSEKSYEVQTAEITLWSKTDALRLAMQHMGMLKTQIELTGKDGTPLIPLEAARAVLADSKVRSIDETPIEVEVIPEDRRLAAATAAGQDVKGVLFEGNDMIYRGIRASLAEESGGEFFTLTMYHPDSPRDVRKIEIAKGENAQQKGIDEINDLIDLYGEAK